MVGAPAEGDHSASMLDTELLQSSLCRCHAVVEPHELTIMYAKRHSVADSMTTLKIVWIADERSANKKHLKSAKPVDHCPQA